MQRAKLLRYWGLILLLTVTALVPLTPARCQDAASDRIAAGDVLDLTVLGEPELTKEITVPTSGQFSYPYLGQVQAAGTSPEELEAKLTRGLTRALAHPQVTVTLHARHVRTVSILGAVKSPGKHILQDGWRVLDALADAGGLTVERPEWASALLIRDGVQTMLLDLPRLLTAPDPQMNFPVQSGDVLLVQEIDPARTHVQILGEVAKPGFVPTPADGSVATALTGAGGPTPGAALSQVTLLRGGKSLPLDLRGLLTDGKAASAVTLEPGDTLVIPRNKLWYAVLGAVSRPGSQDYPDSGPVTVLSALSIAGGQSPEADLKGAKLIRPGKDGAAVMTSINLDDMLKKGNLAADVPLHPGDILYVPGRGQNHGVHIGDILPFASLWRLLQ